jgi:CubicO group peptidase (beta-lactamase class C family)
VNAYSVGKGILATLTLALVERGVLDFDDLVAKHWPEFAAAGKGAVRLRTLLSHQAGLPAVRERLAEGAMLDWDTMCTALAAQAPYWEPGTRHGYHTNTFGFLVGEVIHRATGLGIGEALQRTLAAPLGVEYYWGVPEALHPRISEICAPEVDYVLRNEEEWAQAFPPRGDHETNEMIWHCYFNPSGLSGNGAVNTKEWRLAAIPSTNGHTNARAVAALYEALVRPTALGPPVASDALLAEATAIASDGEDAILGKPSRFGLGFQLTQPTRAVGLGPRSFGHFGYGGSLGFADRDADITFAYTINRPGSRWQTPRTQSLLEALSESLDG